ncbi:winged helix-turn-helix transcriptional regulator [Paenibacillus sp. UMB7766-LJ446]|jgi:DNA-binding HxlR family transcriptional regulator|uniref:HxlR family transcriptional regulator n=2 Tax=Paenibacillus TaxID=44249 RepID=A0A855XUB1_9BACL|nr:MULTISPECIES: winged helix-turn-helix transcriptional regulator [Paenibacillus]OPG97372.1 HxlR family transcriptional regulator [Chryseobacterium mucoviscidosis]KGP83550.1 HxlR family transcriptional regulator [Paenibacillus sp. MAEPY2]KGP87731.1 HxlR family transcriptional regulator [Paenibacillus sp. MAEPY1]MDK8190421.1 winged helix-turn-helix transcriptional regulator [Paenibacillus sp. UMB7766-LJ446]MDN4601352.1 winged helix-turn-helix transcriptional regulator [Paenibacillus vandeheii]
MIRKKYNISVEATLEVIGGKWKCVILCHLTHGKKRTSDLKRIMPAITQKMLTQQLRELEDDGIVNRIVYNQVPPKVEYELSEYGRSLEPILNALCNWGDQHIIKEYGDKSSVLEDNGLNDFNTDNKELMKP